MVNTNLGIMDKSTAFAVGWQLACSRVLEAFDDGGLAGAIVPDDQSQWRV